MDKMVLQLKSLYQGQLGLNDNEFEKMLINIYRLCYKKASDSEDLKKRVMEQIEKDIKTKMSNSSIKKDSSENFYTLFDKNINVFQNSIIDNINQLKNISSFLKKNNIEVNNTFSENLLNNSIKLKQVLKTIISGNNIDYSYIESISLRDSNIINIMVTYCKMNNVKVNVVSNVSMEECAYNSLIKLYYKDMLRYRAITNDEFLSLFLEYKSGSKRAFDAIVEGSLPLVLSVLRDRFFFNENDRLDLIQVGNLALIEAVRQYDLNCNYKFSTYAYNLIEWKINRYLRNNKLVRVADAMVGDYYKIQRAVADLYSLNHTKPTVQQIAGVTELSESRILDVLKMNSSCNVLSLNSPILFKDEESNCELQDVIGCGENVESSVINDISNDDLHIIIEKANLSEVESLVIKYRFFSGLDGLMPYPEIARRIAIDLQGDENECYTRQAISLALERALNKIRKIYVKENLLTKTERDNILSKVYKNHK